MTPSAPQIHLKPPITNHENNHQGLGRAAVQLVGDVSSHGGFSEVGVEYATPRGDDLDTRLLRAMVVKGILEQITTANVNLVNADLLAKERGLRVVETKVPAGEKRKSWIFSKGSREEGGLSRDREEKLDGREKSHFFLFFLQTPFLSPPFLPPPHTLSTPNQEATPRSPR